MFSRRSGHVVIHECEENGDWRFFSPPQRIQEKNVSVPLFRVPSLTPVPNPYGPQAIWMKEWRVKSEGWKIGSLFSKWSLLQYHFGSIALWKSDGWNYRDLSLRILPIAVRVGTVGHRPPIDWRVASPELAQSRMDEPPVKKYKEDWQCPACHFPANGGFVHYLWPNNGRNWGCHEGKTQKTIR